MSPKTISEPRQIGARRMKQWLAYRPKISYGLMLILLGGSVLFNFMNQTESPKPGAPRSIIPPTSSLGNAAASPGLDSYWELMNLHVLLNEFLARDSLSRADSVRLLDACERLENLNKQLNPIKK